MIGRNILHNFKGMLLACIILAGLPSINEGAESRANANPGNFGLPGLIDLPTARRFPDGELIITHQNHKYLFMNSISFQALPRLGVSFRYGGQGRGGHLAYGRVNWDRSFDAHITVMDEQKYIPALSFGLRDFIGTGWYSSEYITSTKSIRNFEITAGLGFGRLAGRNSFSNPLSSLSSRFDKRDTNNHGRGGTLGTINWFQGDTSIFYGVSYQLNNKIRLSSEYTPDQMSMESLYLDVESPWNFGLSYQLNDYVDISAQYLFGSEVSLTANVAINPGRPPMLGGKELAPVPMRFRGNGAVRVMQNNESVIRNVLDADRFKVHHLKFSDNYVSLAVTNTKFRSTAQAVGRIASTLQRFTSNNVKFAYISFYRSNLRTASYGIDLEKITQEQFDPEPFNFDKPSIKVVDPKVYPPIKEPNRFTWGLGPYIAHRLFNPNLPLSMETGLEIVGGYNVAPDLKLSGTLRKSVLTNLTNNKRRSNSVLPRVHSDWPLYDFAGQKGHIHALTLSYTKNIAPGLYGRIEGGLLEPFFAGLSGEVLYKPLQWPIAFGFDIHHVQKRDYNMLFDLRDYSINLGHLSLYYDAGGMFEVEVNAGRYLAGDWGVTTTISRKFGSGWEVGGYATLTDVPFTTFGEGSFDKAIYISMPIDWIISSPNRTIRRLTLRPITRDGGANLSSSRKLYKQIENSQNEEFQRELGRLWK